MNTKGIANLLIWNFLATKHIVPAFNQRIYIRKRKWLEWDDVKNVEGFFLPVFYEDYVERVINAESFLNPELDRLLYFAHQWSDIDPAIDFELQDMLFSFLFSLHSLIWLVNFCTTYLWETCATASISCCVTSSISDFSCSYPLTSAKMILEILRSGVLVSDWSHLFLACNDCTR